MTLEELSAREEISNALVRYTRGVDRADLNLVRGVFHEDAFIQFPESLHQGSLEGFMNFAKNDHPDASDARRFGTDPFMKPRSGFQGTPVGG